MALLNFFKRKEESQNGKAGKQAATVKTGEKKLTDKKVDAPTEKSKEKVAAAPERKQPTRVLSSRKIAHQVLIKPMVTEKSTRQQKLNQYTFEVAPRANKIEIKKAIQEIYGVTPIALNTIRMQGKRVHFGRVAGQRSDWKKVIVTLPPGESITGLS